MKNDTIVAAWDRVEPSAAAETRMWESIVAVFDQPSYAQSTPIARTDVPTTDLTRTDPVPTTDSSRTDRPYTASPPTPRFSPARKLSPRPTGRVHRTRVMRWTPVAAVLVVAAVAIPLAMRGQPIPLDRSSDQVTAQYVNFPPDQSTAAALVWLTETEMVTAPNTVIFRGTVTEVRNIRVDIGTDRNYWAIATITVDAVIRGALTPGEVVTVQVHNPVGASDVMVEDSGTTARLAAGQRGIFMPTHYDAEATWATNEARLYLTDLSEYGFSDGERWAFLETAEGLVLARFAYPSLADATTLDEVEAFIRTMLD